MIHEPSSAAPKKEQSGRVVPVMLDIELRPDLALALAQFCKRVCWSDIRGCAVDDDEAYEMRDAIARVQDALQRHGYAPR
jgi:hypothetical protein